MNWLNVNYVWSNIAGYVAALINNFFWSKYWIFTSKDGNYWREIPLFLVAFACAYGTQFLALLCMVELLNMNEYLAQFIGILLYGAVNFIMNKKVTFQKKES